MKKIHPIESLKYPTYFELWGVRFVETAPDTFTKKDEDGKEYEVTKQSNELMDALIGGTIISKAQYDKKSEKKE